MSITPDEFDAFLGEWKEWQSFPWGKLYYSIVHHNLQRHVQGQSLKVLDIGGGNGWTSIYLAQQGHSVTLLDYSATMLEEARTAAEEQGVSSQISFVQADAGSVQELFAGQAFDLALCHLMVQFTIDPRDLLRRACQLLPSGGLLSLVDTNRYSEVYRVAFQKDDLSAASKVIGKKDYPHPWFNRDTPIYSANEMIGSLQTNGCSLVGHYGIRCLCDYLPNTRKYDPKYYAELERLEFRLTDTYPYYLLARFYQVIMQKS